MPASVLESPLISKSDTSPSSENLSASSTSSEPSSESIYTVAKLAVSFLFVYSAMDALSEYITSLLPDGLGDKSLLLLQAALCSSTLAAPSIVSSIGELKGMMLGGVAHVAYLATLVKPCKYLVLSTSVFCGFGASLTWVAQGTFLTKRTPPSRRGLYTGMFWGIYSLASIVGNLTSFFTLRYLSQGAMFGIGSISAAVGVLLLLMISDKEGKVETAGFKFDSTSDPKKHTFYRELLQFILLFPITLYLGCQTAFWTGEFPKLLPAEAIGLVLFFTGIGQVFGSFCLSWLSDSLHCSTPTFLVGALTSGGGLTICFSLNKRWHNGFLGTLFFEAPVIAYVAGILFGIADGVLTSHVFAITGRVFGGSKPEIWAIFNFLGTAGAAATLWVGMIFPISGKYGISPGKDGIYVQIWIQLVVLMLATPLYVALDLWSSAKAKQEKITKQINVLPVAA